MDVKEKLLIGSGANMPFHWTIDWAPNWGNGAYPRPEDRDAFAPRGRVGRAWQIVMGTGAGRSLVARQAGRTAQVNRVGPIGGIDYAVLLEAPTQSVV